MIFYISGSYKAATRLCGRSAVWHEFSIHDHYSMYNHLEGSEHSLPFCRSTDDYSKIFQTDLHFEAIILHIINYKKHSEMQSFNGKVEHHISNGKKNFGHINVDHSCSVGFLKEYKCHLSEVIKGCLWLF